jgi:hypothetical protein
MELQIIKFYIPPISFQQKIYLGRKSVEIRIIPQNVKLRKHQRELKISESSIWHSFYLNKWISLN